MTRIRYTMPARSQGKLHMQRRVAELVEKDVHRWVFARDLKARDAVKALIKSDGAEPLRLRAGDRLLGRRGSTYDMAIVAFFDIAFLATLDHAIEPAAMDRHGSVRSCSVTLYGRSPFAHSTCVQPHKDKRKPFTVGVVRVRTTPTKATLESLSHSSNVLIEVDAVIHRDPPLDYVCDLGYGIAPGTVIDDGTDMPIPDYHVLWPGKPTTNTVWTAVEDYTVFEAFSEEGCATGIACTPAQHLQSKWKTEDGRRKER